MQASLTVGFVTGAALLTVATAPVEAATSVRYASYGSCAALHAVYPHGVGRRHAHDRVRASTKPVATFYRDDKLYALNARLDADHDEVACEQR